MSKELKTAIQQRRSIYGLNKEIHTSDEKIQEIIQHSVKYVPSAFNSQSARVIVLLMEQHDKLWDITKGILKKIVPEANFAATEEKINSFGNAYGTVLYFEDQSIVEGLQQQFPLYKDNFPVWSQQASGMLQYAIWTQLEAEGLGASLQHYSPLIDEEVRKEWNIPLNWKLIAQMPFGAPTAAPDEKEFQPLNQRIKIYK